MTATALIFSGYNQRAITALCRYFSMVQIDFVIVASGLSDPIFKTDYKRHVVFCRQDSELNITLFKSIVHITQNSQLVYSPTSEYLNHFLFANRTDIENLGIKAGLPEQKSYKTLTNKFSSQALLKDCNSISPIGSMEPSDLKLPCIAKPVKNVLSGKVLYPVLLETKKELMTFLSINDQDQFFFQKYIHGQSYYICGYLDRKGRYQFFWQKNLLQQAGGKSIVFAVTTTNPGLDEHAFVKRILSTGYYGPIMAEFIQHENRLYFIEINPRFWGPLQLLVDWKPGILNAYNDDWFDGIGKKINQIKNETETYYAWFKGAMAGNLKEYPGYTDPGDLNNMLKKYDVYNRADTRKIHMKT